MVENTSILKVYKFSGFGNFSQSFGWDNGLNSSLGENTNFKSAQNAEENLREYNGWSYNLPESISKGVYYTINEHGGSRNVDGFVIANSRRDARRLLQEFDASFEVIEYEN